MDFLRNASGSFVRGYHLECFFDTEERALAVCDEFALHDIFAHMTGAGAVRPPASIGAGNNFRVYIKDCESICNLLALGGAAQSLYELNNEIARRAVKNTTQRKTNCDTYNINKQLATAGEQVAKISKIIKTPAFLQMPHELQFTAHARVDNPTATYDDLAEILGITKSGVVHRLKKILSCD